MLLTAGADGTARLWQTGDGHPVWPEPIHHKGIVWTAQFDPVGRRILTASADKSAVVWDAESGRPLIRPRCSLLTLHGFRQPNFPIQSTMAFPISSGESS